MLSGRCENALAVCGAFLCPVSQDAVDGEDDDPADEDDNGYGSAHGTVHPEQPSEQGGGDQHERFEPKLLEVLILEIAHRLGFLPVESHTHFILDRVATGSAGDAKRFIALADSVASDEVGDRYTERAGNEFGDLPGRERCQDSALSGSEIPGGVAPTTAGLRAGSQDVPYGGRPCHGWTALVCTTRIRRFPL